MPDEEGPSPLPGPGKRPAPRAAPEIPIDLFPDLDFSADLPDLHPENDLTPLDEALLQSLLESTDYAPRRRKPATDASRDFVLAAPEDVVDSFRSIWDSLGRALEFDIDSESALKEVRDLTIYDIPDGTRSTLTVPPMMDVDLDAGMFCLAFVHTMKALGAKDVVIMTHTAYNRKRGPEETMRFLKVMARAVEPVAQYARRHRVQLRLHGLAEDYELGPQFAATIPEVPGTPFEAHFLVDYSEEMFLTEEGRKTLERLPEVDVCVRHTKLQVTGGWIPIRMLRSTYVYCQNGTLFSNWRADEYAALAAVSLLSKKLMSGEVLSKSYVDIDDVKRRYQQRELNLFQRTVKLREDPKKLFVVGSPIGLYQIYY